MSGWIFETSRLTAREMSMADLDFVASMLGDPEIMAYYPQLLTRDDSRSWIETQLNNYATFGYGRWLILDRVLGHPIGQVGLLPQRVVVIAGPEIAYMIARSSWGQGFASEAAAASRDHAFTSLGVDQVISLVRPENLASRAVAARIGMKPGAMIVQSGLEHLVFSVSRADLRPGTV